MTTNAKVLIVDDDVATLDGLGGLLEVEGYRVERAADGAEALEKLKAAEPPRLILLDLKMPVMDGWQFLSERAKDPALARIPVVLLSGLPFIPNATGVADFLAKPINPARLLDAVARICGATSRDAKKSRNPAPRA
jgi:CheY-like chemotaxis protein